MITLNKEVIEEEGNTIISLNCRLASDHWMHSNEFKKMEEYQLQRMRYQFNEFAFLDTEFYQNCTALKYEIHKLCEFAPPEKINELIEWCRELQEKIFKCEKR